MHAMGVPVPQAQCDEVVTSITDGMGTWEPGSVAESSGDRRLAPPPDPQDSPWGAAPGHVIPAFGSFENGVAAALRGGPR
jgi:hypothetical protein